MYNYKQTDKMLYEKQENVWCFKIRTESGVIEHRQHKKSNFTSSTFLSPLLQKLKKVLILLTDMQ